MPIRRNAGAVSGYTYDLFVVPKGQSVDRGKDRMQCVFVAYEDTQLQKYEWNEQTVEIEIADGPVGYYKTFYSNRDGYEIEKVGDVIIKIVKD